ncbi:MAG: MFS transporter [Alphaproteobacteria bacterium]|nr:MFS transporter [Alphaproteobacteria bacterium]
MTTWRIGPATIIACGGIILLLSFGIRSSFGIFLQPISIDMNWSREIFAFSIALQNLFWGVSQPFAGMIADKYGTGRVIVVGGLIFAAGTLLMAYATTPLFAHVTAGIFVGVGISGCGFSIVLAAVGRAVPAERRAIALGIASAGGSFGMFAMVPLGQAFLQEYGWSTSFLLLGSISLIMVPLAAALAGKPPADTSAEPQTVRESLREAAGHSSFLFLNAGYFVCGFHVAFIATHLPSYVIDLGLTAELGAWALGLIGLMNVIGALFAGALGDKFSKKYLLSSLYLGRSIVITVFVLTPPSVASVLIFSAAMGLLWLSTVPLTSALVMQMFGLKHASMLLGIVFLTHQLGSFTGAWLGGYLFDLTGSYDAVWWVSIALGIASSILHWPIDERPIGRLATAR